MKLFTHFIMFNAVNRHISLLSVPDSGHKYSYSIDFKMACMTVRQHYRLYQEEPDGDIFANILSCINPFSSAGQTRGGFDINLPSGLYTG